MLKTILIISLLFSSQFIAQKEIDKMPEIKGGIQALAQSIKYPEAAKKDRVTGTVFIKAVIDENGNVASAEIEKGVNDDLNTTALEAVKTAKFIPGEYMGEKVKAEVTIPIKFKLDGKKKKSES